MLRMGMIKGKVKGTIRSKTRAGKVRGTARSRVRARSRARRVIYNRIARNNFGEVLKLAEEAPLLRA